MYIKNIRNIEAAAVMFTCCCVDRFCMWSGFGGGSILFAILRLQRLEWHSAVSHGILAIYEGRVHFYRCVFLIKDVAADLFLFPLSSDAMWECCATEVQCSLYVACNPVK